MKSDQLPPRTEVLREADQRRAWAHARRDTWPPETILELLEESARLYRLGSLSILSRAVWLEVAEYARGYGQRKRAKAAENQAAAIEIGDCP